MVICHGTACDGLNENGSQMIVDDNQRGGVGPQTPGDGNQRRLDKSANNCTVSESKPSRFSFSAFLWHA